MKKKNQSKKIPLCIHPLPMPNGLIIQYRNLLSICWYERNQYISLILPYNDLFRRYQNTPLIRGMVYLYARSFGPLLAISKFKQKYRLSSSFAGQAGNNYSLWNKCIYSLILVICYYYLFTSTNLLIINYIEPYLHNLVWHLINFFYITSFLALISYLWLDWRQILNLTGFHLASHHLKSPKNYHLILCCELGLFIYLSLTTLFFNSFIVIKENIILQIFMSFISYFLIFGLLFEIFAFLRKNLNNPFCLFLYFPVMILEKNLQTPCSVGQQKIAEIALRQLIKNLNK